MQTVTLDEIHADPYRIDRSIDAGEPIEIFRGSQRVGGFVPEALKKLAPPLQWPDILARTKAIFGDLVISEAEAEEMRAYENGELAE